MKSTESKISLAGGNMQEIEECVIENMTFKMIEIFCGFKINYCHQLQKSSINGLSFW